LPWSQPNSIPREQKLDKWVNSLWRLGRHLPFGLPQLEELEVHLIDGAKQPLGAKRLERFERIPIAHQCRGLQAFVVLAVVEIALDGVGDPGCGGRFLWFWNGFLGVQQRIDFLQGLL
jgi:hypothetical protein